MNKDHRTQPEPAHNPWKAFHSHCEMWGHHPPWLLITLNQRNLGQGLKAALAGAAEAGGGTSPLHPMYSDALLANSVCVHSKTHPGSRCQAANLRYFSSLRQRHVPRAEDFVPSAEMVAVPPGALAQPSSWQGWQGTCKLTTWSSISSCFPGSSRSVLEGLQEAEGDTDFISWPQTSNLTATAKRPNKSSHWWC